MATEIKAHITGTIWKIPVKAGDAVEEGDTLVIIESMKMEMPIEADDDGKVIDVMAKEGQPVNEGDVLMTFEED
jgi:acetyl-CoA carboxylase biotin carboxyl carrier protein